MITYVVKSSLSLIILFGLYWLLLRREKIFVFNRFFLISSVVFSLGVPFISVPVNLQTLPIPDHQISSLEYIINETVATNNVIQVSPGIQSLYASGEEAQINISAVLVVLYFSGLILFLVRFLRNIYLLKKSAGSCDKRYIAGFRLVLTTEKVSPCCFFSNIYLNRDDYLNGRIDNELLDHELEHVKQFHTVDILIIELVKIVYWFNPVLILYDRAIRLNHEYLADNRVINGKSDLNNYMNKLLNIITGRSDMSLTSGSFNSSTKQRLLMMLKPKSGSVNYSVRITLAIFLLVIFSLFMSLKNSLTAPAEASEESGIFSAMQTETVKDIDGNIYRTVMLGNHLWMAENLRTTRYNDGKSVPYVLSDEIWQKYEPAYCWYDNDEAGNKKEYGGLYNWYAVNTGKLCPEGWHVPGKEELVESIRLFDTITAPRLKSAGGGFWKMPEQRADNETGFSALPGGFRRFTGEFGGRGESAFWWTSSQENVYVGFGWTINSYSTRVEPAVPSKRTGFSVRCIKDQPHKVKRIMPDIREINFIDNEFRPTNSLVVINGSVLAYNENMVMEPDLIRSFRILKDDEAMNKYGEKGKDGVVEIALHGKKDKTYPDSDTSLFKTNLNINRSSNNGELIDIPVRYLYSIEVWTYDNIDSLKRKRSRTIGILTRDFFQVKGKVLKPNGRPLSGVKISSTDNPVKTISNRKGFYKIEDVRENSIIEFSRSGYKPYYLGTKFSVPYKMDMTIQLEKSRRRGDEE